MPLSLSIQPFSDVLDMYGGPDPSSTFSLAGHVSISLISPSSMFARRRTTTRVLLHSLSITFEGQSETLTPQTGYASVRLCSITRELLPNEPAELSNEGHEDSDKPCSWSVVFDIPVPGWLPTSSIYGDASLQQTGTCYALYATATFAYLDLEHSLFPFANICVPLRTRIRTVDAPRCPIKLRRFVEPRAGSSSTAFPMFVYTVDARREPDADGSSRKSNPPNALDNIQIVASIPSAVAMHETSVPFVLRLRGKKLNSSERERLRITEFSIDVEQIEVYRRSLTRDSPFRRRIPRKREQPPRLQLRHPHPIHTLYETGVIGTLDISKSSVTRVFSLLPPTESGRYTVSGDGRIFTSESNVDDHWYIMETTVPISAEPFVHDWAGPQSRRITESSPLFTVEHSMHVTLRCEYIQDSGEATSERLQFSLPMKQVCTPGAVVLDSCESGDSQKNDPFPFARTLPAYSQLFHSNGERRIDYSIPLPLYEPPSASSSSAEFGAATTNVITTPPSISAL